MLGNYLLHIFHVMLHAWLSWNCCMETFLAGIFLILPKKTPLNFDVSLFILTSAFCSGISIKFKMFKKIDAVLMNGIAIRHVSILGFLKGCKQIAHFGFVAVPIMTLRTR